MNKEVTTMFVDELVEYLFFVEKTKGIDNLTEYDAINIIKDAFNEKRIKS